MPITHQLFVFAIFPIKFLVSTKSLNITKNPLISSLHNETPSN